MAKLAYRPISADDKAYLASIADDGLMHRHNESEGFTILECRLPMPIFATTLTDKIVLH